MWFVGGTEVGSSGGFSLFGDAPADRMLTAYGLQEFADMSKVHDVDPDLVRRVARLVDTAEYKRRQFPPGPRVTTKAFGKDRRLPITNGYRDESGL